MTLPLEKLQVYQISEEIADAIWDICSMWEKFTKDTVGNNLFVQPIQLELTLLKVMGDIHLKKMYSFVITRAAHTSKPGIGYEELKKEHYFRTDNNYCCITNLNYLVRN